MNYYKYDPDADHYNGYAVAPKDKDRVLSIHFDDGPLPRGPVKISGFDDTRGEDGDFPSLSSYRSIPIFSNMAWEILHPILGSSVKAIPALHPSGKSFFLIHVKDVVDCVDMERSVLDRYTDGSVMGVAKYHLKEDAARNRHMFKTPRESGRDLLVDDVFRNAIEANDLKGLLFEPLPTV